MDINLPDSIKEEAVLLEKLASIIEKELPKGKGFFLRTFNKHDPSYGMLTYSKETTREQLRDSIFFLNDSVEKGMVGLDFKKVSKKSKYDFIEWNSR